MFPLRQSILLLQKHNLITVDRLNKLIKIHRVLQDSVTTQLTTAQKIEAFDITVQLLYEIFPTKEIAIREGFQKVCQLGDKFYPQDLATLSKYHHLGPQVQRNKKLNALVERLFW